MDRGDAFAPDVLILSRMRTGVRVVAVVLSAWLGVACSDPQAAPLPSASPPATPSPSPTPVVSPSVDYEAQARRAVAAYFEALNAALRDPATKTDALAALIDPACTCRQVLDLLRELASDGHYIDYRYTVSDVRVQQAGSLGASLTYVVNKTAGARRSSDGRVVRSYPGTKGSFSVHLRNDSGSWLLDRVDQMR